MEYGIWCLGPKKYQRKCFGSIEEKGNYIDEFVAKEEGKTGLIFLRSRQCAKYFLSWV